jgi:hypothetical protein
MTGDFFSVVGQFEVVSAFYNLTQGCAVAQTDPLLFFLQEFPKKIFFYFCA